MQPLHMKERCLGHAPYAVLSAFDTLARNIEDLDTKGTFYTYRNEVLQGEYSTDRMTATYQDVDCTNARLNADEMAVKH
jgi:hypothetical protein